MKALLGEPWTLELLESLALGTAQLELGADALRRVEAAHGFVISLADAGDAAPNVYGVNTGFGALAETRIGAGETRILQHNLLRSHAVGVGSDLSAPVVRAMIALRAQVLALGFSGVRPAVIEQLMALHRNNVLPRIPAQGSVGASGDLAPLAHLALVLIGEGEADVEGQRLGGAEALARVGMEPLHLEAKEGLALINGHATHAGGGFPRSARWRATLSGSRHRGRHVTRGPAGLLPPVRSAHPAGSTASGTGRQRRQSPGAPPREPNHG